jgi:hypothetical protein
MKCPGAMNVVNIVLDASLSEIIGISIFVTIGKDESVFHSESLDAGQQFIF